MNFLSKIAALFVITSILGFEVSHLVAHAHELEHSQGEIVIELDNDNVATVSHDDDHQHSPHEHLDFISKNERFNTLNLKAPEFEKENVHFLSLKKELILSVRRTFYQIKSYEREHSFLYKNPFQFRNRFLLI